MLIEEKDKTQTEREKIFIIHKYTKFQELNIKRACENNNTKERKKQQNDMN